MPRWFLAARFLLGLGCAASFMASVVLCARWHAGPGLTTALARVFALSQGGILLAGAPFAAAAEAFGWRGAYAVSGLLTLGLAALWWAWVRDDPPDRPPPVRPAETLLGALRGQLTVWRTPGLLPVLAMHLVGYAAMATVIAVWAGPYLSEVHGLAPGPRGAVLFAMGLALVAGLLGVGPLERRLNTRKWLVAGMASGGGADAGGARRSGRSRRCGGGRRAAGRALPVLLLPGGGGGAWAVAVPGPPGRARRDHGEPGADPGQRGAAGADRLGGGLRPAGRGLADRLRDAGRGAGCSAWRGT